MKMLVRLLGLVALLFAGGCVVAPADYPSGGVSVGVYDEYPYRYYGHGGYYPYHPYRYHGRWHHPYDRDRYFYRDYRYR